MKQLFSILLTACVLQVTEAKIIISEIMYHPAVADTSIDDGLYEFLEFSNIGTTAIDVSGYLIDAGVVYLFPNGTTINPGRYVVIVRDSTAFKTRYPGVAILGQYVGGLANSGETINVVNKVGQLVTKVTYDDASPWPSLADGFGFSLVPIDESSTATQNNVDYWTTSAVINGSPGTKAQTANQAYEVYVNEVLSASLDGDIVELYNNSDQEVDISYWYLTDDRKTPKKFSFPNGTKIPAKGYFIVNEISFNLFGLGFSFSSKGDQTYIFAADANKNLTGYSHGFSYDAQLQDVSFGRVVNSVGKEYFVKQKSQTFGAINSGPAMGPFVIEKIMYNPTTGLDEFIVIKNISTTSKTLSTEELIDSNSFRMSGVDLKFPAGNVLVAANETIVLTSLLPSEFRTKYTLSATAKVYQYLNSAISNGGESLKIEAPIYRDTLVGGSFDNHYMIIDEVDFNDKTPWPSASANGQYIQRIDASGFGSEPTNWIATSAQLVVGLENETFNNNSTALYPTITASKVTISSLAVIKYIEVIDYQGKVVLKQTGEDTELNLSSLPFGNYMVKVITENTTSTTKIMKY